MAAKAPRYAMRLDFTAADDAQAERLAAAWADTCAAEYATTYHSLVRMSDGAVLTSPPTAKEHTMIKVGDRVRATCGESVIVGTVATVLSAEFSVIVDGDAARHESRYFLYADWIAEILPPPVPDVVGTIVRDRDGDAWQRYDDSWWCIGTSYRYSLAEVQKRYGPLTVLWTPEVTPWQPDGTPERRS